MRLMALDTANLTDEVWDKAFLTAVLQLPNHCTTLYRAIWANISPMKIHSSGPANHFLEVRLMVKISPHNMGPSLLKIRSNITIEMGKSYRFFAPKTFFFF